MSNMRILTLDIETCPNLVYVWHLFGQYISIDNIVKPTEMLCWAAKWKGQKKVHFRDKYDKDFLEAIYDLLEEADAVVTFNGIAFDLKHLNREFAKAGFQPPHMPQNIDLIKTLKKAFKLPSNKLDYAADYFLGKKKVHVEYQLWLDCMLEYEYAWRDMRRYNIADVNLTEELYEFLLPWIVGHPNHGLYVLDQDNPICRNCGSAEVGTRGWQPTSVRGYMRYKCRDCGWNGRGRDMVKGGKDSPQVTV